MPTRTLMATPNLRSACSLSCATAPTTTSPDSSGPATRQAVCQAWRDWASSAVPPSKAVSRCRPDRRHGSTPLLRRHRRHRRRTAHAGRAAARRHPRRASSSAVRAVVPHDSRRPSPARSCSRTPSDAVGGVRPALEGAFPASGGRYPRLARCLFAVRYDLVPQSRR